MVGGVVGSLLSGGVVGGASVGAVVLSSALPEVVVPGAEDWGLPPAGVLSQAASSREVRNRETRSAGIRIFFIQNTSRIY